MADDWQTPKDETQVADPASEPTPEPDPAPPADAEHAVVEESTPDYDDIVKVTLSKDATTDDGEPLEELSSAGIVLTPGETVEVSRGEALVFDEDDRVEIAD